MFCLLFLLWARVAWTQEMALFNPAAGRYASVSAEWQQTGRDVTEARAGLSVPLHASERQVWSASLRGQLVSLSGSPLIADRAFRVPRQFGGADVGLTALFPRETSNQGASATIGATGRRLLHEGNARAVSLTYFHEWKRPDATSWYLFVAYANNRATLNNVPLPGFAYSVARESYRLLLGAPFLTASWTPGPWRLGAFASPFSAALNLGYVIRGPWQAQASAGWYPRSFQNLAPDVDGERLLYDKKEWSAGLAFQPAPPISVSLQYVYGFDRRLFVGRSVAKPRSDAADLADGGGLQFKARLAF